MKQKREGIGPSIPQQPNKLQSGRARLKILKLWRHWSLEKQEKGSFVRRDQGLRE